MIRNRLSLPRRLLLAGAVTLSYGCIPGTSIPGATMPGPYIPGVRDVGLFTPQPRPGLMYTDSNSSRDSDGDGIRDSEDSCPNEPSYWNRNGCPRNGGNEEESIGRSSESGLP